MPSFHKNASYLESINNLRLVVMRLSADGIKIISFKSKDGKTGIEVSPDERLLASGSNEAFNFYDDMNITVYWRK